MNKEFLSLVSEKNELEAILSGIPESDIIERSSFQARLQAIRRQLEGLSSESLPQTANLTFRGRPVFGSYGMTADFASQATRAFSDAFAAVVVGFSKSISDVGPIPGKIKNGLVITGTAIGSFGFQLQLPAPISNRADSELALEKIQALFRASSLGSDDVVAELVDSIHPRAIKKVTEFLQYLVSQNALCGLDFKGVSFKFDSEDAILLALSRLRPSNIKKYEQVFDGEFLGFLPESRSFEFRTSDGETIKGAIGVHIVEPESLHGRWLKKRVQVSFSAVKVGDGRPRYSLLAEKSIKYKE